MGQNRDACVGGLGKPHLQSAGRRVIGWCGTTRGFLKAHPPFIAPPDSPLPSRPKTGPPTTITCAREACQSARTPRLRRLPSGTAFSAGGHATQGLCFVVCPGHCYVPHATRPLLLSQRPALTSPCNFIRSSLLPPPPLSPYSPVPEPRVVTSATYNTLTNDCARLDSITRPWRQPTRDSPSNGERDGRGQRPTASHSGARTE